MYGHDIGMLFQDTWKQSQESYRTSIHPRDYLHHVGRGWGSTLESTSTAWGEGGGPAWSLPPPRGERVGVQPGVYLHRVGRGWGSSLVYLHRVGRGWGSSLESTSTVDFQCNTTSRDSFTGQGLCPVYWTEPGYICTHICTVLVES